MSDGEIKVAPGNRVTAVVPVVVGVVVTVVVGVVARGVATVRTVLPKSLLVVPEKNTILLKVN